MTQINFPVAHIKFSISPMPEARVLKNRTGCWTTKIIIVIDIATINGKFGILTWKLRQRKIAIGRPTLMVLNSDWSSLRCLNHRLR
jgi:hypothetical protein